MKFYNPYHFIPVSNRTTKTTSFEDVKNGTPDARPLRHDHWARGTLSGRVLCRLRTVSPTLVGNRQHELRDAPGCKEVENYKIDDNLAIPANSLRGVIGSLAETLSSSAMRVLDNQHYSVRVDHHNALCAIGLLEKTPRNSWIIKPLCLTSFDTQAEKYEKWKKVFLHAPGGGLPPEEWLAAYIGTKGQQDNNGKDRVKTAESWQKRDHDVVKFLARGTAGRHKQGSETFFVGEYYDFTALASRHDDEHWLAGGLYAMGDESTFDDMPRTKKHALFVPMGKNSKLSPIPVPEEVIAEFEAIAAEVHDDSKKTKEKDVEADRPYMPNGYNRPESPFLRSGDLIYFDIEANDELSTASFRVSQLSYSAIWRKRVPGATYDFFSAAAGKNILPWGSPERDALTPAEAMFGVVEDTRKSPRNLASRIRFSDARIDDLNPHKRLMTCSQENPVFVLKILASPKPPSPAMYFHQPRGGYIAKEQLRSGEGGSPMYPNGRKIYRHGAPHKIAEEGETGERWMWDGSLREDASEEEKRAEEKKGRLKLRGRPIKKDTDFWFHVDFENLSQQELHLLLLAINPPAVSGKSFYHKIGLGKPIGLGSVQLEVAGVFLVDRRSRYRAEESAKQRYASVSCGLDGILGLEAWNERIQQRYPIEWQTRQDASPQPLALDHGPLIDEQTLRTLQNIAAPYSENATPVCYPMPAAGNDIFTWFVKNGDSRNIRQVLMDQSGLLDRRYWNVTVGGVPRGKVSELTRELRNAIRHQLRIGVSVSDIDSYTRVARMAVVGRDLERLRDLAPEKRKVQLWDGVRQLELQE